MGCVCCSLSSFISILLHGLERISLCTVCALLVCCLLFTIFAILVMGIGIGFHYCFVQHSVDSMASAAKAAGELRSGPVGNPVMRSVDRALRRGNIATGDSGLNRQRRDAANLSMSNEPPIRNITSLNVKLLNVTSDKSNATNSSLIRYLLR